MKQAFKVISAKNFFPKYADDVKNYTHKMRGVDGNGKEIAFTAEDKKSIKNGIQKMAKDLASQVGKDLAAQLKKDAADKAKKDELAEEVKKGVAALAK